MEKNSTHFECDRNNPECFSAVKADPWETDYAALVPRFTGSLSAISSVLIIYVIMRSETRLSKIYHRIMFGMSLADVLSSTAMALTSLPMPSYMPKEEVFGYEWAGTRLGNEYTCDAQGFFAFFGMGCMFNYNAMLCVYYACAIAFGMRERNIEKYVEPLLHVIPFLAGLVFSVPPLFYDMYNPGISAYAWCGPVTYPGECAVYQGVECIRGNAKMRNSVQIMIAVVIIYVFIIIFTSLGLVIWKVVQTDRMMSRISQLYRDRGDGNMLKVLENHRNTKAVVIQAISYITAFLLGVVPPLLLSVGAVDTSGQSEESIKFADKFEKLVLVFLPLQGFFNFIIFVSFKVYNYRRVRQDVSIRRVIALLFCSSTHDPCFISRISVVMKNNEDGSDDFAEELQGKQQYQVCDLDIKDESNDELHFRLGLMNHNNEVEISAIPASQDKSGSISGTLSREDPSNNKDASLQTEEKISTSVSKDGEIQSHNNGSSLLSFASRSSFTSSLWARNLSIDEESVQELDEKKRNYYRNFIN
jgi:hypothetical protein